MLKGKSKGNCRHIKIEKMLEGKEDVEIVSILLENDEKKCIIVEHDPSIRVYGNCKGWGYHVWGTRAYSILYECPTMLKLVSTNRSIKEVKYTNGWITLSYSLSGFTPEPWLPISVYIETSSLNKAIREGILLLVPYGG
ncbi:hypothetical protein EYM_07535 [Ignicoccus islandicus DSM 13165]|uniref:Uncharacterized protein n=2 Tax=Ignicoccus islandicus TaxID=54259 RepID=A0A0U2WPA4_9CREN|nr:hypothetical protein EYM_07535 [Ignicoccus islandicus DSM 13165]